MNTENHFYFKTGVIGYPILFVLVIWVVFWFEIRFGFDFNHFGVVPRTLKGMRGIFFSPFIHSGIEHLWHNTLPLLILSAALFFFYAKNAWKVLLWGAFLTGVFTWIIGRPSYHIGASGVIYMLFGFLFFKGVLAKHFRLIALSLVVVFVYGSMIWYTFPVDPKISWEGHSSGLLVGTVMAFLIKKGIATPERYAWEAPDYNPEEDDFLKHFDEDGNFIEHTPEMPEEEIIIVYNYKELTSDKNKDEEE
ncbi:rhomboid family intramembrane serine protease [Aquimarina hainanensis]|uniref:Rhomboid family intramembrane serine protease n=1 Tax=Aquimarina hainanensis TaxID=1578017 RepID=A0ABW5N9B8_9FLAO|nr:rhomboid family intramembrane serine protease [Aquimarina sp. TRL1]QKX03764.1 rhomboid family intramembrane serine protease [Aquimarina sp. TRL1]